MKNNLNSLKISKKFHLFLENLSKNAQKTDRTPFIGREKEIEAVLETLLRKLKNNLILVGKPGVGKTALITELASNINRGLVPKFLKGRIILEFSMNAFFYSRDSINVLVEDLERLFSEIKNNKDKIILFLDDLRMPSTFETKNKDQSDQIQNLLKSYFTDRELTIIAATTPEYYYKSIKSDEIMTSHFSTVLINEPGENEMLSILRGVKSYFENYYSLKIHDTLFEKIFFLCQKFIPNRAFPHKAIDLLDVSCSRASLKKGKKFSIEYIYQSISNISKIPIDIIKIDPQEHCKGILEYFRRNVVNQGHALEEISRIIRLSRLETGADQTRPEGIFLFLGATGVGKSYVASKIAKYLFGSEEKLRIIDLIEYKKQEDVQKLLDGNKSEPGALIKEIENHPFSVIFFENILDAHSSVLNSIGKVVKKGEIIDPFGRKYFMSNNIFILSLTSIGEEKKETSIGFVKDNKILREIIIPPKIMNVLDWVDEIIQFSPLTEKHLKQIANEKLKILKVEIKEKYNTVINVNKSVFNTISYDSIREGKFAHSVSEFIDRKIKIKLLDMISKKNKDRKFEISVKSDKINIRGIKRS